MPDYSQSRPLIGIRCVRCGNVVVDVSAVAVTYDSGTDRGGTCWIRCRCGTEMLQGVGRRSIDLLRRFGAPVGAPWLGPITRREIRVFRRRLTRVVDVASVASAPHRPDLHSDPSI